MSGPHLRTFHSFLWCLYYSTLSKGGHQAEVNALGRFSLCHLVQYTCLDLANVKVSRKAAYVTPLFRPTVVGNLHFKTKRSIFICIINLSHLNLLTLFRVQGGMIQITLEKKQETVNDKQTRKSVQERNSGYSSPSCFLSHEQMWNCPKVDGFQ